MISPEINKCVKNDVDLNKDNKNMLIMGPTGSGKTRYLEYILKCLKYSNIGIVPAENMEYTPFKYIFNNIFFKKINKASKNENENGILLDFEKYFNEEGFKLLLMDEIYSSTTPEQAFISAKNKLTKFMKKEDTTFIATSHFKEHINLCKESENRIKNYFVLVNEENEGNFVLKFKILPENKNNKDKNWWFREEEEFYKKRLRYAIWKEKIEKEKLLSSKS